MTNPNVVDLIQIVHIGKGPGGDDYVKEVRKLDRRQCINFWGEIHQGFYHIFLSRVTGVH